MSIESTSESKIECYRVAARATLFAKHSPIELCDGILTESWRLVDFSKSSNPAGVPAAGMYGILTSDYLTYEAAIALAWTIIAQHPYRPIECRLVRYKLEISYKSERIGSLKEIIKRDYSQQKKHEIETE